MAGRPRKQINQEEFEKLCALQCTKEEICCWFDVTDKTLERWCNETYGGHFSDVFSKKRVAGKISLRRAQFQLAQKSAAMAIFLGKNYLGQSDTVTLTREEKQEDDPLTASLKELAEELNNADQ